MIKRKAIDFFSRLLASHYRNRLVDPESSDQNKVNIGCGLAVAPGWINVDGSLNAWIAAKPLWVRSVGYRLSGANRYYSKAAYHEILSRNRFVFHDITMGLPFPDRSVDFIFSSHFLEHLSRSQASALLVECARALKLTGVLRIGVPDLEYAWELYRRGEKERMLHDYFFTDSDTGFSQHRYAYDFELLSRALSKAGFKSIKRCSYRTGLTPDLQLLDNREEYTLFVEAQPSAN